MQLSKSRAYVLLLIGLGTVLSIAFVQTASAMSRGNIRSLASKSDTSCQPISTDSLAANCNDAVDKSLLLVVKYGQDDIKCDAATTKDKTHEEPTIVKFEKAGENARYTLLMADPDAPNVKYDVLKFYLHWAVTDIKGEDLKTGQIREKGKTLIDYMGPNPPKGSGVHRYQFILFESTNQNNVNMNEQGRNKFSLVDFVGANKLCNLVGLMQFTVASPKVK